MSSRRRREDEPEETNEPEDDTEETTTTRTPVAASVPPGAIPITPPPGTDIRTEIKTTFTSEAPPTQQPPRQFPTLRQIQPPTPHVITDLVEWLYYWRKRAEEEYAESKGAEYANVENFLMSIVRDRDPLGAKFRVPCNELISFGQYPFTTDAALLKQHLYVINNNSGGKFRIVLWDGVGDSIAATWTGELNHTWRGVIADAPQTENEKPAERERAPKQKSFLEEMREFSQRQKELKEILGIEEKKDSESDISKQLGASVVPQMAAAIVSTTAATIQEVTKAAAQFKNPQEDNRGTVQRLVDKVAESEQMQERLFTLAGTALDTVGGLFGSFVNRKRKTNPPAEAQPPRPVSLFDPADETEAQPETQPEATEQTETELTPAVVFEYLLQSAEQNPPRAVNVRTDEVLEAFRQSGTTNSIVYSLFVGKLRRMSPEQFIEFFVSEAEKQGKGERARAVAELPTTRNFVLFMQNSLKGGED